MTFNDEEDYIMRIIKEMVRVLFSLMLGKQYKSVELQEENKYEVSGKALEEFKKMIDEGFINEAENILLESIDYTQKREVLAAILFYQYISEKDIDFLEAHNYSKEEALDGIRRLARNKDLDKLVRYLWKAANRNLLVIWFAIDNPKTSIHLLQQNHPHQLMRKCHFRKTKGKIRSLQHFLPKPDRPADHEDNMTLPLHAEGFNLLCQFL